MSAPRVGSRLVGLIVVVANVACGSDSDSNELPDAAPPDSDAATVCPALELAPEPLRGGSPFGDLDLRVAGFGVADCLEISRADLTLQGPAGDSLAVNFPYPVEVDGSGLRFVGTSFDAEAGFRYTPASGPAQDEQTYAIHVDVATWQERERIPHDIEVTVTITDPEFAVAPVLVSGTFCKWRSLLCAAD